MMSKQLTKRQFETLLAGVEAYNRHQVFVDNHNRIAQQNSNDFLPHFKPLSHNFYNLKLYAGSRNGSSPSGAAHLKRAAKKRNAAKARASKR